MNFFDISLRALAPKVYAVRWSIYKIRRQQDQKWKSQPTVRVGLKQEFREELMEWKTWLTEIRDKELVRKAMKMDIDLDDVAIQPRDDFDELGSHFELVGPGYECLRHESRKELQRLMRERAPVYRRERRQRLQLVVAIVAGLTGLTGAITGLIALLRK